MTRRFLARGLIALTGAFLYGWFVRPAVLTWGATEEEANGRLPGDELLEDADGVATRAIKIEALPSAVWPWIAQMGPSPRGGAYTYDWIENLLGLEHAQHRSRAAGVSAATGRRRLRLRCQQDDFRDRRAASGCSRRRSEDGNWVWTFVLEERGREDSADQPQPLPPADAEGQDRDDPDGAGVARDGTPDAPGDQAARGEARRCATGRHPHSPFDGGARPRQPSRRADD